MAYKDLLLSLNSYPEATPISALQQAFGLADLLKARITSLAFEVDMPSPASPFVNIVLDIPGMVATEKAKSVANAQRLLSECEQSASKYGIPLERVLERGMTSQIPEIVTDYARLRDLTMIPIDTPGGFQQYVAESVIFGSGRPVLVYPAVPVRKIERLDTIGVAWDFSRPAARAVADALPLLQRAKLVRVVTISNEKTITTKRSGAELARHLACHGVQVVLEDENADGRSVGQVLEKYAAANKLDLLVMGAYGHSRIRDFILGGATKSIMAMPPLPVLLSH